MKQNLNVVITMGITALYLFGLGFLVYKLMPINNGIYIIYGTIILIFIISAYILYILLDKLIYKQMEIIE